jgi:hypothetical protein
MRNQALRADRERGQIERGWYDPRDGPGELDDRRKWLIGKLTVELADRLPRCVSARDRIGDDIDGRRSQMTDEGVARRFSVGERVALADTPVDRRGASEHPPSRVANICHGG